MTTLDRFRPQWLSVLRVVTALLFMQHGLMKAFGFPGPQAGVPDPLPTLLVVAAWLEIIGGALLALGLFTRPVAFVLSGLMAVAYWMAHGSQGFYPALNGGELAVLYCFVFFYFVLAGPGAYALDNLIGRRSAEPTRQAA